MEQRFSAVADSLTDASISSDGLGKIASGITELVSELQDDAVSLDRAELEVLLEVFETFVIVATQPQTVEHPRESLQQLFETEARKRMAGLSISLMGVFQGEPGSIELTTGHLHAIKGSSAMLGLTLVADLTGVMEQVVFDLSRQETKERKSALKPLLRAFAILESLIETPDEGASAVATIKSELEVLLGLEDPPTVQLEIETVNEFLKEYQTDVQVKPLEKRILVVDDEATIAASVAFVLADLDLPVDVASDGAAALDRLNTRPYSLVISDIGMPNIDGFSLLEAMRSDHQFADIPFVLLTARDNEGFRKRGEELGCQDYIVKGSIGGGALRSRVEQLLAAAPSVPKARTSEVNEGSILVFERSETIGTSIAFALSDTTYDLTLVTTEEHVWSRLKSGHFDLVIVSSHEGSDLVTELVDIPCIFVGDLDSAPANVTVVSPESSVLELRTIAESIMSETS